MKAKVFISFCFLFIFTIFISNVSATTIEDLYSKDNVFTVKNLLTGETKEVTIPKFTKGDLSEATNYVLVYKNVNDYFFQFTSDNKNYIVVYSNISGGYEIRRNGSYQVIGSDVYYQDLGDYYLSSSGNLYGENVYIYSTCDLYKVTDRDEAMQEDLPENAELITSSMEDDTIGDPNSRLQVTYEYNEDNTECKINATIKDGSFTDKIFYSNYMPGITGELLTKIPFPIDGITITDNQSLFFQAEDKDGNIIATNSISIYNIGKLSSDLFNVTFNFSKGSGVTSWVTVLPSIADNQSIYYDLYYKIVTDDLFASTSGHFAKDYTRINNNEKMSYESTIDCKFTLFFEIRNSVTGEVALTKSYDVFLSMAAGSGIHDDSNGGITGGTVNGEPVFDFDWAVNIDWSLPAAVENIKNFFETSEEFLNLVVVFLSILPLWIVMPLYTFIILAGIIFVFHAIRG